MYKDGIRTAYMVLLGGKKEILGVMAGAGASGVVAATSGIS